MSTRTGKQPDQVTNDSVRSEAADISIIIVNYNVEDLLENCLVSIDRASGELEIETTVVDNASTDRSVEMVKKKFPGCNLIASSRNLGFSRANNLGIESSTGRYILLLNPDTVLEPDVLRKMIDFMDRSPDVGMASCKLVTGDGTLDLACRRNFPSLWDGFCRASGLSAAFPTSRLFANYNMTYLDENDACDPPAVNGAFMFVRREALDEVGPLDEDYFIYIEDLDWCYRFQKAGWKISYYPETFVVHLKGQSGKKSSSAMIHKLFESTEIFYRKHYFPSSNILKKALILSSLKLWKWTALFKNSLKSEKRTRP